MKVDHQAKKNYGGELETVVKFPAASTARAKDTAVIFFMAAAMTEVDFFVALDLLPIVCGEAPTAAVTAIVGPLALPSFVSI